MSISDPFDVQKLGRRCLRCRKVFDVPRGTILRPDPQGLVRCSRCGARYTEEMEDDSKP